MQQPQSPVIVIKTVHLEGRVATYEGILGGIACRLRVGAGLTRDQAAEALGCHRTWYGRLERGEVTWTASDLFRAEEAFNVRRGTFSEKALRVLGRMRRFVPVVSLRELSRHEQCLRPLTVDNVLALNREIESKLEQAPVAAFTR